MNRFKKKPFAMIAVAALSAGAALVGTSLFRDAQFAHARDVVEESRQQLAQTDVAGMGGVFRLVGKVMEPSVVNIAVTKAAKTGARALPFDEETLKKFFPDRDKDGQPDLPEGFGGGSGPDDGMFESKGTGSGVIMEIKGGSGFILTNNHVAGGATEIEITLADGRVITNGKVLGTDAKTDLAVIEVKADKLIPAKWGDSDGLQRGDLVMAFGSPFGYVGSMTHGIVSALNRQAGILADRQGYENFIQVDCPINPGNSGGPLTNLKGEVVGINTAIATRTGSFSGIGFAIPANQAKFVYGQLKEKGKVSRGWLGVSISDVAREPDKAKSFGYSGENGVLVEQTMPNTPATGKLRAGDIITSIDGKPAESVQSLRNVVAATAPNTELKLNVFREGKAIDVPIKLGEQPEELALISGPGSTKAPAKNGKHDRAPAETLGMTLSDLTPAIKQRMANILPEDAEGAVVTQVVARSAAWKAGIRAGDVVSKVGDTAIMTAHEAADALAKVKPGDNVRLYVTNINGSRFVLVKGTTAE